MTYESPASGTSGSRTASLDDMASTPEPESDASAPLALDPSVLLIDAGDVARRLSISRSAFYKLVATRTAPQPIRLGRRTLWRVEELEEWVRDGCPPIDRWERLASTPLLPPAKARRKRASVTGD